MIIDALLSFFIFALVMFVIVCCSTSLSQFASKPAWKLRLGPGYFLQFYMIIKVSYLSQQLVTV